MTVDADPDADADDGVSVPPKMIEADLEPEFKVHAHRHIVGSVCDVINRIRDSLGAEPDQVYVMREKFLDERKDGALVMLSKNNWWMERNLGSEELKVMKHKRVGLEESELAQLPDKVRHLLENKGAIMFSQDIRHDSTCDTLAIAEFETLRFEWRTSVGHVYIDIAKFGDTLYYPLVTLDYVVGRQNQPVKSGALSPDCAALNGLFDDLSDLVAPGHSKVVQYLEHHADIPDVGVSRPEWDEYCEMEFGEDNRPSSLPLLYRENVDEIILWFSGDDENSTGTDGTWTFDPEEQEYSFPYHFPASKRSLLFPSPDLLALHDADALDVFFDRMVTFRKFIGEDTNYARSLLAPPNPSPDGCS